MTMSTADVTAGATRAKNRIRTIVIWVVVLIVFAALADLLGWDIRGWLKSVWDTMTGISTAALVGSILVKTLQTTATAFAWYSILRFAYPGEVRWLHVLAAYAASVALNGILPANLGTLVLLIMFTQVIASATFAGILGAYGVEKIFFCVIGIVPPSAKTFVDVPRWRSTYFRPSTERVRISAVELIGILPWL